MDNQLVRTLRTWSVTKRFSVLIGLAMVCAVLWEGILSSSRNGSEPRAALKSVPDSPILLDNEEDAKTFLTEQERIELDRANGMSALDDDSESSDLEEEEEENHPTFILDSDESDDEEEDEDDGEPFEPAPRTHHGPYNEILPNEKYFIYSPSGGFNNQREELVNAIEISRMLNRTLYVPMAGRHTNFFSTYEKLHGPRDLFSMDRILDFPHIESYGVKVVPLNMTIMRFVAKFIKQMGENKVEILYHPERPSAMETWHRQDVFSFRAIKKNLLFLRGRGFYHRWFAPAVMTGIRKHTRYSEYLRQLSMKVVEKTFGKNFYAIHVRLGDYKSKYDSVSMFTGSLVKTARNKNWRMHKYPVYVATDDPRKSQEDFGPIYSAFSKVMFADDVPKDLVKEFRALFPKNSKMSTDMMGILEQLMCAQALDFVGTSTSTFSAWISTMRALRKFTFPEIGAVALPEPDLDDDDHENGDHPVASTDGMNMTETINTDKDQERTPDSEGGDNA